MLLRGWLQAVRCLYSKAWSHRHAAIVLITRRVMESVVGMGGDDADDGIMMSNVPSAAEQESDVLKLQPSSAKVFLQLASVLEIGLLDNVATVRSCMLPVNFDERAVMVEWLHVNVGVPSFSGAVDGSGEELLAHCSWQAAYCESRTAALRPCHRVAIG